MDDDQSIYGFRGSDPGIMLHYMEDFPSARIVKLSVNYRSAPGIVDAAGIVVSENTLRIEKDIVSGAEELYGKLSAGEKEDCVDIREFKDRDEEVEAFRKGFVPGEKRKAAILLRTNELMSYFSEKLSLFNIAFSCPDKIKNIYDHFVARDILSYLSLAAGDMRRTTLFQVMNRPYRGISRNAVSEKADFNEIISFHRSDMRTVAMVTRLVNDLKILSKMKPYAAVHYILKGMGYEKYLKEHSSGRNMDPDDLLKVAEEVKLRSKPFRSFHEWKEAIVA